MRDSQRRTFYTDNYKSQPFSATVASSRRSTFMGSIQTGSSSKKKPEQLKLSLNLNMGFGKDKLSKK